MPTFQITSNGGTYEIDAPDENSAFSAFSQMSGGGAPAPAAGQSRADLEKIAGGDAPLTTFLSNAVNTATLNVGYPIQAGIDYFRGKSSVNGFEPKSYQEALDNVNRIEEARSKLSPNASMAGTGAGIIGPIAATIATGGAAAPVASTALGRMGTSAATGAGMGFISEGLRTNDERAALGGAALGGVLGGVASPVADGVGKVVGKAVDKFRGPQTATLAPEASTILDDAFSGSVPAGVAERAIQKGGDEAAAREAVLSHLGIDASKGQLTRDFKLQQLENNMAKSGDAFGPRANIMAEDFFRRQDDQIAGAKAGVTGGSLDPTDAAERIIQSVRDAHTTSKQGYQKLYNDAFSKAGGFDENLFAGMGTRIRTQLENRSDPIWFDESTARTNSILKRLDDPSTFRPVDGEVPLRHIDNVRKQFTRAISDSYANPTERRALTAALNQFEDHLGTGAQNGLYRGDQTALSLLEQARQAYAQHASRFNKGQAGSGGNIIAQIVDDRVPVSTDAVVSALFGKQGTTNRVNAIEKLDGLGIADPWKQAKLTQVLGNESASPETVAKNIEAFLKSDLSNKFTTTEKAKLKQLQRAMEMIADGKLRGTSSNAKPDTSTNLASILGAAKSSMNNAGWGGLVGAGFAGFPGAAAGMIGNYALMKGAEKLANRSYGKQAQQLFNGLPDWSPASTSYRADPNLTGYLGGLLGSDATQALRGR